MRWCLLFLILAHARCQVMRTLGPFQEVFAWKQVTFNIQGTMLLQDRFGGPEGDRNGGFVFDNTNNDSERDWNRRPTTTSQRPTSSSDESSRFFIQYNNLPMGVERVGQRLFITLPRRRYGIPATLNYLDMSEYNTTRSPGLHPYPSARESRMLTSVYRTRADQCNRLWMVDTGLLEIPNNRQQMQRPSIVVFDLNTDRPIMKYNFKTSDIPSEITPTGLPSITLDIPDGDCGNAFAYVPDLATFGLIVYSLRENDSWRLTHNYFHFNPLAGNLRISGQSFQWNDGIFSVTLAGGSGCRNAYFHAMVGTHEFSVSTCTLRNRTASSDSNYWSQYTVVGDRGASSQSTMHGFHAETGVVFFADIARSAISCWNTAMPLSSSNIGIVATDSIRLNYPSDLHVTGDEVWVMANSLPTWAYGRLDTNEYNFFIYRGQVRELIRNTVCELRPSYVQSRSGDMDNLKIIMFSFL